MTHNSSDAPAPDPDGYKRARGAVRLTEPAEAVIRRGRDEAEYGRDEHEAMCRRLCPIDLGSDHAIGWTASGDLHWLHKCSGENYRGDQPWRWSLGTIDVTSGTKHQLRKRLPVYVGGSVLCPECGDHGFINDGKWVKA